MRRKKKIEPLAEIGPTIYNETIDITSLTDTQKRYLTTTTTSLTNTYGYGPYTVTQEGDTWVYSPSITYGPEWVNSTTINHISYPSVEELQEKWLKEVIGDLKIYNKETNNKLEHIVYCDNDYDLSVDRVLKVLSALKGEIMLDIAPIHIKELECSITPTVRKNIVMASKKLNMYGKKRPIISQYDEWGNPLPDEIDLGTEQGVTLKIVDPKEYGEYYFELKAIEFPSVDYITKSDWSDLDLPF